MLGKKFWVPLCGLSLLGGVIGFKLGQTIPLETQRPAFEALQTTAGIVLAIVGIWMSILFPGTLQKIFKPGSQVADSEVVEISLMVWNLRISAFVLAAILLLGIAGPAMKAFSWSAEVISAFRGTAFATLCVLTTLEIWTLLMTLAHANSADAKVAHGLDRAQIADAIMSNTVEVATVDDSAQAAPAREGGVVESLRPTPPKRPRPTRQP